MEVVGSPSKIWKFATRIVSRNQSRTNNRCLNQIKIWRTTAAMVAVMLVATFLARFPAKHSLNMLHHGAFERSDDEAVSWFLVQLPKLNIMNNCISFNYYFLLSKIKPLIKARVLPKLWLHLFKHIDRDTVESEGLRL